MALRRLCKKDSERDSYLRTRYSTHEHPVRESLHGSQIENKHLILKNCSSCDQYWLKKKQQKTRLLSRVIIFSSGAQLEINTRRSHSLLISNIHHNKTSSRWQALMSQYYPLKPDANGSPFLHNNWLPNDGAGSRWCVPLFHPRSDGWSSTLHGSQMPLILTLKSRSSVLPATNGKRLQNALKISVHSMTNQLSLQIARREARERGSKKSLLRPQSKTRKKKLYLVKRLAWML